MTLNLLISGHERFKERFDKHRRHWSKLVGEGQDSQVLWMGCSGSRVIPEQITADWPRDLFVIRDIPNVVPPYCTSGDATSAVLECAVQELGVEHIIVCGHTSSSGVKMIMVRGKLNKTTLVARWVSWMQPALDQVEASGIPEEVRYPETIKANVLVQIQNVESYSGVSDT